MTPFTAPSEVHPHWHLGTPDMVTRRNGKVDHLKPIALLNYYGSCLAFIFYVFILPMLTWSSFLLKKCWLIHSNFDSRLSKTKATPYSLWVEIKSSLQLLWSITPWASKAHHLCPCFLGLIPYLGFISHIHMKPPPKAEVKKSLL